MANDPISHGLISRFVGDERGPAQRRTRIALLEGYTSVVTNTLLFVIKMLVGWLTGSIALLADAIHTLADSVTSAVVLVSAYVSRRPADREHPFGHGRAELVAALVVSVLLGVAGVEFGKSSFQRVFAPEIQLVPWWATAVIAATALIKEWLSRFAFALAREAQSKALEADAWHHKTDVIATLLVVVAMVAARFDLAWIDGVIGMAVSAVILWAAVRIAMDSVTPLLGEAPTVEELGEVEARATSVEGVRGVHDIIIHKYGETRVISLHVETPHEISLAAAHTLAEQVQEAVGAEGHGLVVVHVDPVNEDHPHHAEIKLLLGEALSRDHRLESFHDLRIVGEDETFNVLVDVAVHENLDGGAQEEISRSWAHELSGRFPKAKLHVQFEPVFAYGGVSKRQGET